jgi:ferredoxin
MAHVITRLCRDCVDAACVDQCPVDCIVALRPDADLELPNQLFIAPDECICCSACESICPWGAIYEEGEVPQLFHDDIALNAVASEHRESFDVPTHRLRRQPSPAEVAAHRERWTRAALADEDADATEALAERTAS